MIGKAVHTALSVSLTVMAVLALYPVFNLYPFSTSECWVFYHCVQVYLFRRFCVTVYTNTS